MRDEKVLYIVGGRSFSASNPGRKISEVIGVWKNLGLNVKTYFGRDIITKSPDVAYGNQKHFDNKVKNNKYLKFFKHSISELKDIVHDRKLYKTISNDNENIDLIWERSSRLHWSGLKLAKKQNVPFVLEWKDHLVDYKYSFFKKYALHIENRKIKEADFIVVESTVLKQYLIHNGVKSSKIYVALNAVNPNEFKRELNERNRFIKSLKLPLNKIIIGYLGSYAFYHNTILLIEAAALVLKEINGVQFLLVGNGMDYQKCKLRAKNLGILDNGLFMLDGVSKEEVPQILSSIDYSILPGSTDIICPIKIMEYMSAETLVFAPKYRCNQEIINTNTGILFEPHNERDLALKILNVLQNQDLFKEIPKKARNYVEQHLTWEKTWGNTLMKILNEKEAI